ncbi:histone deacetylase 5 [Tanacetum coccineum]
MADQSQQQERGSSHVGLVYDKRMCKHSAPAETEHHENPERIRAIWNKLVSAGIPQTCEVFKAKQVEDKYIKAIHSEIHTLFLKTISSKITNFMAATYDYDNSVYFDSYNSVYFNKGSSESAYLAAGSMLQVVEKDAKGELDFAFAIVRAPDHHVEEDKPMGFYLFNNVAIATQFLLDHKVHHGNGTQKMCWKDPRGALLFWS